MSRIRILLLNILILAFVLVNQMSGSVTASDPVYFKLQENSNEPVKLTIYHSANWVDNLTINLEIINLTGELEIHYYYTDLGRVIQINSTGNYSYTMKAQEVYLYFSGQINSRVIGYYEIIFNGHIQKNLDFPFLAGIGTIIVLAIRSKKQKQKYN